MKFPELGWSCVSIVNKACVPLPKSSVPLKPKREVCSAELPKVDVFAFKFASVPEPFVCALI